MTDMFNNVNASQVNPMATGDKVSGFNKGKVALNLSAIFAPLGVQLGGQNQQ